MIHLYLNVLYEVYNPVDHLHDTFLESKNS